MTLAQNRNEFRRADAMLANSLRLNRDDYNELYLRGALVNESGLMTTLIDPFSRTQYNQGYPFLQPNINYPTGWNINYPEGFRFYAQYPNNKPIKQIAVTTHYGLTDSTSQLFVIDDDDNLWGHGLITGDGFEWYEWFNHTAFNGECLKVVCGLQTQFLLTKSGDLYAHGLGANNALGTGSTANVVASWTQILSGISDISAAYQSAFAVQPSSGQIFSWGNNLGYRTGQGTNTGTTSTPTALSGTDWGADTKIASCATSTTNGYTVAQKSDGTWWAWGTGSWAVTGASGTTTHQTPTQLSGWPTKLAKKIFVTGGQTIVIFQDGTLYVCGNNDNQSIGLAGGAVTTLTQIGSDTDWSDVFYQAISVQAGTLYYIKTDGSIYHGGLSTSAAYIRLPIATYSPNSGVVLYNTGYKLSPNHVCSTGTNNHFISLAR